MKLDSLIAHDSGIENIVDENGTLTQLNTLNAQGKHFIIAPNHITPPEKTHFQTSKICGKFGISDDFPALKHVLETHGISTKVVFQTEFNGEKSDSSVVNTLRKVVSRVKETLRHKLIDGYSILSDNENPGSVRRENISRIRIIMEGIKTHNTVIFPYASWYPNGQQEFSSDTSYNVDEKRFFETEKDGLETWRNGIKPGFIKLARSAGTPIVPIYLDRNPITGAFVVYVGAIIQLDGKEDLLVLEEYLAEMRKLRSQKK